jgi:hypothetical protein
MAAVADATGRRPSRLMAVFADGAAGDGFDGVYGMVYGEAARRGRVVVWRVIGEVRREPVELRDVPLASSVDERQTAAGKGSVASSC